MSSSLNLLNHIFENFDRDHIKLVINDDFSIFSYDANDQAHKIRINLKASANFQKFVHSVMADAKEKEIFLQNHKVKAMNKVTKLEFLVLDSPQDDVESQSQVDLENLSQSNDKLLSQLLDLFIAEHKATEFTIRPGFVLSGKSTTHFKLNDIAIDDDFGRFCESIFSLDDQKRNLIKHKNRIYKLIQYSGSIVELFLVNSTYGLTLNGRVFDPDVIQYFPSFHDIILSADKNGASDVHLREGENIAIRTIGEIRPHKYRFPADKFYDMIVNDIFSGDEFKSEKLFIKHQAVDTAVSIIDDSGQVIRLRINCYKTREGVNIAIRILPKKILPLKQIGIPAHVIEKIFSIRNGLILVSGATGSGKSTSLASLLYELAKSHARNIITLEQPVEYILPSTVNNSIINQIEVDLDKNTFASSLVSCMRQDPDVILVGEMRDKDTIETAIRAADTGHLVFATVHANSAGSTFSRIISQYEDKASIKTSLTAVCRMVISQNLIRNNRNSRSAIFEIMFMNTAISNAVMDENYTNVTNLIELSVKHEGMVPYKLSISKLHEKGLISEDTKEALVNNYKGTIL